MAISGKVIECETFEGQTFQNERFSGISHCAFYNCTFIGCIFDDCCISRTSIVGSKFVGGCSWRNIRIIGKCDVSDCNVEILNLKVGGRGYVAVLNKGGAFIGCLFKRWSELDQGVREQVKSDGRNAVNWWRLNKSIFEKTARDRGWIS